MWIGIRVSVDGLSFGIRVKTRIGLDDSVRGISWRIWFSYGGGGSDGGAGIG